MASEPSGNADRDRRLDEIVTAYLKAVEAGERPQPQQWLERYPDLASELSAFFAAQQQVAAMAEPLPLLDEVGPGTETVGMVGQEGPKVPSTVRYVGDYELLSELGRGGMGIVYQARHTSLKRLVALKMILAGEHAGDQDVARFRAEAEAVARLQHPHIVQIYEIGVHEGHPYFSLEYCPGGSLAAQLDGTPLPGQQAAAMVETLARAMHTAHEAGIVHRDLKPANVLLTDDGTPKITDFGLAKRLDESAGQTATGAIMGSPSYMAPEQAAGKGKDVGPAADVYALGSILYELLTGRPPFRAASALDTLLQVVADDPVPPTQLQSKTPKDLETICLKCLQKDPEKRYASALALAEDLQRFQAGQPIQARPASVSQRTLKWVRRRPLVAGLLTAVFLVTVLGIAAFAWAFDLALQARDDAITEKNNTATALAETDKARKDALASAASESAARERAQWLLYFPLNLKLRRNITPAENANVLLWKAYGPRPQGFDMPAQYFELLGAQAPPEHGQYFIPLSKFMKGNAKAAMPISTDKLEDWLSEASQRPWTPQQYPEIVAWLEANARPLVLAVEASKRPYYFSPIPPPPKGEALGLLGARLPGHNCRDIVHALIARSMRSVAEGQGAEAWQDLLACHRLARLLPHGGTSLDVLIGITLDRIAAQADLALLNSGQLNTKQTKSCLRDLQQLPPMSPVADAIGFYDRLVFFEVVIWVERGGIQALEELSGAAYNSRLRRPLENVDWSSAVNTGNRWFDRLTAAMRLKDPISKTEEFARIDADLKAMKKDLLESGDLPGFLLDGGASAESRGKRLGDLLICLMSPAAGKLTQSADRHEQGQHNLQLAFALACYRQDHNRYPEKLEALAPDYLPEVPQDLFSGKALIYRPTEKSYLLYSVGINGRDDQGRSADDDPPGDDLAIRMPIPQPPRK